MPEISGLGLVPGLLAVPAAVADIQVQAVGGGEGREQVLDDAHRVLLVREHEVAQGHERAHQAHVPEGPRDHRLALAARSQELDQPAATEHQGAGQADQLPWGQVDPGPVQPRQGRIHEVRAHGSSSVATTRLRRISQATPRRSAMPTIARWRLLYLDTPAPRWRWLTGTLNVFQPARCIRAGRYRCMWSKYGRSRKASRSNSLVPQPVSGVASRSMRARMA